MKRWVVEGCSGYERVSLVQLKWSEGELCVYLAAYREVQSLNNDQCKWNLYTRPQNKQHSKLRKEDYKRA